MNYIEPYGALTIKLYNDLIKKQQVRVFLYVFEVSVKANCPDA